MGLVPDRGPLRLLGSQVRDALHRVLLSEFLLDDGAGAVTRSLPFALLLALSLSACACSADHVDPGPGWSPITRIQSDPGTPRGVFQTLGTLTLTGDACDFASRPAAERRALGLHESYHARRELEVGLAQFLRDYARSRAFRWAEESAGWRLQLEECVRAGVGVDVPTAARFLSGGYDGMIGFEEAVAWVAGVVTAAGAR